MAKKAMPAFLESLAKNISLSIVRHTVTSASGALAAQGWIDGMQGEQLLGCAMFVVGLGWGIYDKYQTRRKVQTFLTNSPPTQE